MHSAAIGAHEMTIGSPNPIVWSPLSSPSPSDAIKTGQFYLLVDRKSEGLIMLMSANVFHQNIVLVGAPDEDMAAANETIRRLHRIPQRQGRNVVADATQRAGDRQTIQTRYLQPSASCAKPGATMGCTVETPQMKCVSLVTIPTTVSARRPGLHDRGSFRACRTGSLTRRLARRMLSRLVS
jgi:hypothetical protein